MQPEVVADYSKNTIIVKSDEATCYGVVDNNHKHNLMLPNIIEFVTLQLRGEKMTYSTSIKSNYNCNTLNSAQVDNNK